jgi:hypothetical protein
MRPAVEDQVVDNQVYGAGIARVDRGDDERLATLELRGQQLSSTAR